MVVSLLVAAGTPATAADIVSDRHHYSNQTPYGDPASTSIKTPPRGYQLVQLQNVGRHGSRSQTNAKAENRALKVWSAASRKGALTTVGKQFGDDVKAFQKAERGITYGHLSATGKAEWQGIGRRTAANYPEFWARVAASRDNVKFSNSPVYRTEQTASALRAGLSAAAPGLDLKARTTDKHLLISNGASKAGNAAVAKVLRRSDIRAAARHVLRRLYSASYVKSLNDPVGKALDIYSMYAIAPGLKVETEVTFDRYVPVKDAKLLALAKDAGNFYRYGPGVKGETRSYRQARPVLKSFFEEIDARLKGGHNAASFRLGHGETTMPFAALIDAPGSQKQASKSTPYSYGNNPWRGWVAGRMAGNIEWALYRNASGKALVTMRYNEQPVRFTKACKASSAGRYFYRVSTLKRCLG